MCILNADVRAAREKNGVYISHERFAKEEAEKKVLYLFLSKPANLNNITIILYYILHNITKILGTLSGERKTSASILFN
jgi:hypothetical protein